ncbi:MAG: hypothetical protein ACWGHH_06570 [Sulfurovaceae bacterium]
MKKTYDTELSRFYNGLSRQTIGNWKKAEDWRPQVLMALTRYYEASKRLDNARKQLYVLASMVELVPMSKNPILSGSYEECKAAIKELENFFNRL